MSPFPRPAPTPLVAPVTIIVALITLATLDLAVSGPGLAVATLAAGAAGFVLWRWSAPTDPADGVAIPYMATIVSALAVATGRYLSGFAPHLHEVVPALFAPRVLDATTTWLLADVVAPVSLMLFGGFWWLTGRSGGRVFPWIVFVYGIGDAMVQLAVEVLGPPYDHAWFIGAFAACCQFAFALIGLLRLLGRLRQTSSRRHEPDPRTVNLWTALFAAFGLGYGVTLYAQAGPLPVGVIVGSMVGGLVGWRRTTAHHPADPVRLVPLYLLMLALFYVHVGEEELTAFNRAIALITGKPWPDADFTVLIALVGPAIWVLGAISLALRQAFGNFILWFMVVGMILGEPTHLLVFPVIDMLHTGSGYAYFPGMATALFPMIPAIVALATLVADARTARTDPGHAAA